MVRERTADLLYHSFVGDYIPDTCVLVDYWGENIDDDETIAIIYGVYKGLSFKGITADLLHKCFKANRLDELIHKKYKYRKSGYYDEFVRKRIIIGKTYYYLIAPEDKGTENFEIENFEILDDNTCPSCYSENYYTKNYVVGPPDCPKCFKFMCEMCSYYDNKQGYVCCQCSTSSLENNIRKKISTYKKKDIDRFGREGTATIDDILQLLRKQNFTCYVCDEKVITSNWKPFCCYQFSIDRINNNLPHDRNNVLISCYYCNCRHYSEFNQPNKICNAGCHTETKNIVVRTQVDKDKINNLLLTYF